MDKMTHKSFEIASAASNDLFVYDKRTYKKGDDDVNQLDLTKRLKELGIESVYLLFGEEKLLINQAVETIRSKAIPPELMDFNYEVLPGDKATGKQIVDLANTMPFMAERRVLVVDQPVMLSTTGKGEGGKGDDEVLLAYLDNPNPYCTLIFKCDDKVDKRKKLYKQLNSKAVAVEFALLKGGQLEGWINEYVAGQSKTIDRPALGYLSAMGSYTLEILANELDKVMLYAGDQQRISLTMVQNIVTKTVEANIFDLIDAIGEKKGRKAIGLLQDTLYLGEAPLKILALLVRRFRQLLIVKDLKAKGQGEKELREKLKLPPFVISKSLRQAGGFSVKQLSYILEQLLLAEVELKSSSVDGGRLLERLVIDLCYID